MIKKCQPPTSCIANGGGSASLKHSAPHQVYHGGYGRSPQTAIGHTRSRWR